MITRVQIKNYRSIEAVDVHLEPLTVLVGRNGSGKSSFVDAIKLVRDAMRVGLENAIIERHGFGSICRYSAGRKRQIEIGLTFEEEDFYGTYELVLASNKDGFKIVREKAFCQTTDMIFAEFSDNEAGVSEISFERQGKDWTMQPSKNPYSLYPTPPSNLETTNLLLPIFSIYGPFSAMIDQLAGDFHTIFPNTLRQPQKPMNERSLSDHGDNFVSVLQHLIGRKQTKAEITNVLSRVVNGISDIRVRSAAGFLVAELQHQDLTSAQSKNGKTNTPWFDLSQESDGTLRMLGLLTALYQEASQPDTPLLAIEEPEIALHPGALAVLADELKACSKRRPLLVTTQSPDLIARVAAKDIRVVEKVNGVTQIGPIEESQRQVIEDQLFNAGDLLRIEGLRSAQPSESSEATV